MRKKSTRNWKCCPVSFLLPSTHVYTVGAGLIAADPESEAVLEGDSVTLVCGTDLTGNPIPTVVWRDSSGRSVCGGTREGGGREGGGREEEGREGGRREDKL